MPVPTQAWAPLHRSGLGAGPLPAGRGRRGCLSRARHTLGGGRRAHGKPHWLVTVCVLPVLVQVTVPPGATDTVGGL